MDFLYASLQQQRQWGSEHIWGCTVIINKGMPINIEEDVLVTVHVLADTAWAHTSWPVLHTPVSWSDRKPQERRVRRIWQQPPRCLVMEWCSPIHTLGSHNLMTNPIGSGAYPASAGKDLGCLVAPSQHRNTKPEGTLKGSPWPRLGADRPALSHPERCSSSCSWSLPKQSYHFPSNLNDRENWLQPRSSQQLHITPLCCGSCAKTVPKLCVA